ncbi:ATP phosphoribosyltransferase regulatory subunit [Serratia rhizosphaerae]|uniref:ATP phosphoribosyltransferase regulatory subunit n=1 Tax=Serratia rhizosphaerae TaxID=2597702 RepID=UPI002DB751C0|nr:ATP phosphoribosyltransferase regulatory subunit [Serratia rhizosphaerae]MEB6334494.1 ATP phosphoribosyltransferase regulatory subunit [Serratia rhizosphaerae]
MSRRERIYIADLPQLIQLKGHNHGIMFFDEADCQFFLNCLDNALKLYSCELHAYALLPHRLLLLLTPETKEDLSRFIQHIGRSYVPYYNNKYHRSGALWEGRYDSCLIEPGAYLLLAQQYVDTYERMRAEERAISQDCCSYRHNIGEVDLARITPHAEYVQLGATPQQRTLQYRRFIQAALSPAIQERIQLCLSQNCVLGTAKYCQKLETLIHRHVRPRHCGRPRKHYHNQVADWVWLESQAMRLLRRYGYQEIRLPLLEVLAPEQIDSVFTLTNEQMVSSDFPCHQQALLRGDGTIGSLRAIARYQDLQTTGRLWYLGTMFRRTDKVIKDIEQYQQVGVEAFGYQHVDIELEQIMLQYDLFQALQLTAHVELKLNTIASAQEFAQYRAALRLYYQPFLILFDEAWLAWLQQTPEKLLQIADPLLEKLQAHAPRRSDFISAASRQRFEQLTDALNQTGIPFVIDADLYPANDYCHTIFEWHSDKLDHDTLLCRGGRYDARASSQLSKPVFACGFAFMLDPIMRLLQLTHENRLKQRLIDVIIIPRTPVAKHQALSVGQMLREAFPQLSIANDLSHRHINVCKRNASRQGCRFILVVPPKSHEQIEIFDKEIDRHWEGNINAAIGILSHSLNT